MVKIIRLVLCILCIPFAVTGFCKDSERNWIVGVQDSNMPKMQWVIRDSFHKIDPRYPQRRLIVKQLSVEEIYEAVKNQSLDFVAASPQVVSVLERYYGYELLASLYQQKQKDFYSETTALVFADQRLGRWSDLAGKTLAFVENDIPDTMLLVFEELRERGLDPKKYLNILHVDDLNEAVKALKKGEIDAFAISSCLYREVDAALFKRFRIVKSNRTAVPKTLTPCSTMRFPGWAFASSIRVNRETGEDFATALREFDFSRTVTWDTASDYRLVHEAQEALQFEPYMRFRQKTFVEFLRMHIAWVGLALLLLLALIAHNVMTARTVRRLTSELTQAMQKKRQTEKRLETLERITSISQISTIVAHELRQPLAAITNFSMGIRRRANNKTLTPESLDFALGKILLENERASAIVEHVRNYAKRHKSKPERLDLSEVLQSVIMTLGTETKDVLSVSLSSDCTVNADRLEMALVMRNLLKNALEAVQGKPKPHVFAQLCVEGTSCVFRICDNGVLSSDEELERLSIPMTSEKHEGLGLGLSIARRIIESHDGTMRFERNLPEGLKVTVLLPFCKE